MGGIPSSSSNYSETPKNNFPCWLHAVGKWGLPYSTAEEPVAFLDEFFARYESEEKIKKYLSKTLFIDAEAAKALCERGFGKYLGVEIGAKVTEKHERLAYDLGAREVILEKFRHLNKGAHMPGPYMYSNSGSGDAFEVFIRPDLKKPFYVEVQVNADGMIWPLLHKLEPVGSWQVVNSEITDHSIAAKASRTGDGFLLELRIPFKLLPGLDLNHFSFMLLRTHRDRKGNCWSSAVCPLLYNAHNVYGFIPARIKK